MLTINLLPPEEKKSIRLGEIARIIYFFGIAASLIFSCAAILLLPSFFFSRVATASLEHALRLEESAAGRAHVHGTSADMRALADAVGRVSAFISAPGRASEIADRFLHAPPGIAIQDFSVRKDGGVSMTGTAATRESLLSFEQSLRDAGWFENVSIPLSSIIQETNIHFTLQGMLKSSHRL